MLNQPVFVSIRNLSRKGRNLSWLPKAQKWVEGGETIEVPYEPWSCASDKQREEILAELESRNISLTLTVVNASGSYDSIPYDPSKLKRSKLASAPATQKQETVKTAPAKEKPAAFSDDHVVIAGSTNVDSFGLGLKASIPQPKQSLRLDKAPTNDFGFGVSSPVDAEHSVIAGAMPKEASEENKTEEEYNRLTAAKKWAEALALLKERFGDKVTFGIRAVMANKEYKSIVDKFNLE